MNKLLNSINIFFENLIGLTVEMSPWLLIGFFFAGVLKVFVPKQLIFKQLGSNSFFSSLKSSLFGIPLPLCSCGVIPTAIAIRQNGASKSATNSFLISTPQTGVDSIFATYSLLGLPYAIARPIIALFTGILGGVLTSFFDKDNNSYNKENNISEKSRLSESSIENESINNKILEFFRYGFFELVQDIAKWLIIGLVLAAIISSVLPSDFFTEIIDEYYLQMLLIVLISIPLYVCATGSIPIVTAFLAKGLSPGLAIVFLMAGPATNSATLAVLFKSLGSRTTFVYLFSIFFGAIVSALFIDFFLADYFINAFFYLENHQNHLHSLTFLDYAFAIILILIIANALVFHKFYLKDSKINQVSKEIEVLGMTCNHCKASVEKSLIKLNGITQVEAFPSENKVKIVGEINLKELKNAINDLGFESKIQKLK